MNKPHHARELFPHLATIFLIAKFKSKFVFVDKDPHSNNIQEKQLFYSLQSRSGVLSKVQLYEEFATA